MNAYGVFQTFYKLDTFREQSSSNISWIGSTQAFLLFLTSIVVGPIFDAGHLKLLLRTGTFFTVVGMFMTSICHAYWQAFLAQGIMVGFGFGCLYLPAPALVSQYFSGRRALAIGISSTGSALGKVPRKILETLFARRDWLIDNKVASSTQLSSNGYNPR